MVVFLTDANILIDIIKLDLIDQFFQLGYTFITTEFIFHELNASQQSLLRPYISNKKLVIIASTSAEILEISTLLSDNRSLSFQDCSALYFALKLKTLLLTGDKRLKNQAISKKLDVKGILFIFDQLVEQRILSKSEAFEYLKKLQEVNQRLPKSEIESRLKSWS